MSLENLETVCLNLESSLTARLESTSAKLEVAGSVDLLICFDSFHIIGRSPLILLLVLGESRLWQITAKFDLRFDLD